MRGAEVVLDLPRARSAALPPRQPHPGVRHTAAMSTRRETRARTAPAADTGPSALVLFALLAVALLLVYSPALRGTPVWDDSEHMTNAARSGLGGLGRIWFVQGATWQFYPVTHTLFWLQNLAFGSEPLGHHVVNVVLHAANASLVYVVLRKLALRGALLGALLFAFHPAQVESVAWISELKNVLSGVFYLAAFATWLDVEACAEDDAARKKLWWRALALFACALLAKAVTATLPAALLLVAWWRTGALSWKRNVRPLVPFFALAVALGSYSVWMEKHTVGAQGELHTLAFAERWLVAGRAAWFYARELAWPARLTFIYERWELDPASVVQWLAPASMLALIAVLFLARGRIGRGPVTALLFFLGTLVPALGFVDVFPFRYAFVADHFQYLASLGLLALAAYGIANAWERAASPVAPRVAGALVCLPLAFLSWRQSANYASSETLWRATIANNPRCWMAYSNLGTELKSAGRIDEAIAAYRAALAIDDQLSEAHFNLANALTAAGRHEESLAEFARAAELDPDGFEPHNNWGNALFALGRLDEAVQQFERAIELEPKFATAHFNLGAVLAKKGESARAIEEFERALALAPDYSAAHNSLGVALAGSGRMAEARQHFVRAIETRPGNAEAYNNLGLLLGKQGDFAGAAQQFRLALQARPDHAAARENLEKALKQLGAAGAGR